MLPAVTFAVLGLGALAGSSLSAQETSATSSSLPPSGRSFFSRLAQAYREDWHPDPNAPATPAPLRRGLPSPLTSPPFPSADWSYGGSPVIGEPDTNTYPLMTALRHPNSRSKLYGWFEPTVNGSTSSTSNSPTGNDAYANRVELAQLVVYLERLPDTVQQDHVDWGYHLTALFGSDYRFTTNKGYFSSQYLDHKNLYGFDPALEYVDVYFPHVGQGMNLRIGRFISIPGIEAQLAPNNYIFSHSLLYSVDPFTDTGALATIKLSNQWLIQLGITAGHDVAPWTSDAKASGDLCLSYTTASSNDNLYTCANGINSAKYAFNNVQQYDQTWYHKFSKSFHMATEGYFMYMRDVPSSLGRVVPEAGVNEAVCTPGLLRCTAPAWAVVNYLNYQLPGKLADHNFISFRNDFLNDKKGQRTGVQTRYYEATLSWTHWIGTTVQFRPEVRLDHALDRPSYNNGASQTQFTAAADMILHF